MSSSTHTDATREDAAASVSHSAVIEKSALAPENTPAPEDAPTLTAPSSHSRFADIGARLDEIAKQVKSKNTSLDECLDLFDEAIALGSSAVDLVDSLRDIDFDEEDEAASEDDPASAEEAASAAEAAPTAPEDNAAPAAPAANAASTSTSASASSSKHTSSSKRS